VLNATVVALNLVIILSNKESRDTLSVIEFVIYRTALAITPSYCLSRCNLRLSAVANYYTGIFNLALQYSLNNVFKLVVVANKDKPSR
jgi:hypothetical protein